MLGRDTTQIFNYLLMNTVVAMAALLCKKWKVKHDVTLLCCS